MSSKLNFERLRTAVQTGVAARSRVALQPAGGEGTKVFPPTYAGAVYATEKRRLPGYGDPVDCVLLDSVQSQANRLEEALQQAIDSGRLKEKQKAGEKEEVCLLLPVVEVDFTGFWDEGKTKKHPTKPNADLTGDLRLLEPVGKVTSLQAPHRIVDAILRDSVVVEDGIDNGKSFRSKAEKDESSYGKRLRRISAQNATALFELCPTALLLGMWDSTGPKGGLGAKFERAMVSEVVGINAVAGVRSSSRIDPLAIQLEAGPVYVAKDDDPATWTLDSTRAKIEGEEPLKVGKKKDGKPSEINHGNIKPDLKDKTGQPFHGGVTIKSAEQTIVLSFPALRRLNFPIDKLPERKTQEDVNNAARTVLAALGLCAAALAAENGLDLRSRCLLWPTEPLKWELLGKPGEKEEGIALEAEDAIKLLKEAIDAAKAIGLPWREQPLQLVPSDELVKLVVKSQELAQKQGGEGGE
jgi:CRISPR-associated protein Csb1